MAVNALPVAHSDAVSNDCDRCYSGSRRRREQRALSTLCAICTECAHPLAPKSVLLAEPLINQCNRNRLPTLLGLDHPHPDLLAFGKCLNSRSIDDGDVEEHILAAVLGDDEPEALLTIEPLHRAVDLGSCGGIRTLQVARHLRRHPRWRRGRGACIDLEYRRDLGAFMALTDLDTQLSFR